MKILRNILALLINKIDHIQESLNNESSDRKREIEQINEKLDRILSLLTPCKNDSDFTKYRTNTFVNSVIPKPIRQKSSNENDNYYGECEERNQKSQIDVREYDNSEQLLNDVIGTKLKEQNHAKILQEDNQVKQFVNEDYQDIQKCSPKKPLSSPKKSLNSPKKEIHKVDSQTELKENVIEDSKTQNDEDKIINDLINDWTTKSAKDDTPIKINHKDSRKGAPISHESIKFSLDRSRSEELSENSQKVAVSESKVYKSEDEFMQSIMEEIKEESSIITSSKESKTKQNKANEEDELKKTVKSNRRDSTKKLKIEENKPEIDPLELLSKDYDVVDRTVEGSSDFQDTIIGSQFMMKYSNRGSKQSEKTNKENKVPPLRIKQTASKYNNAISVEDSESLIDMLLSEEGEIKEEMIIQISEKSANKNPPVRIKNSNLVKVDPVERFQEILRNSKKNVRDDIQSESRGKNKPNDYMLRNINEEESVKLEDLIGPLKNEESASKNINFLNSKQRKQISAAKPKQEKYK